MYVIGEGSTTIRIFFRGRLDGAAENPFQIQRAVEKIAVAMSAAEARRFVEEGEEGALCLLWHMAEGCGKE